MATPKTGRWQVPTETSVYLLDLDARQLIRVPDAGTGNPDGPPPIALSSLRRDYEPVALLRVLHRELGAPCNLFSTSTATASRHSAQPRACATFVSSTPPTTRPGARLAPPSFSPNVAW
jgi:hypothetical protein